MHQVLPLAPFRGSPGWVANSYMFWRLRYGVKRGEIMFQIDYVPPVLDEVELLDETAQGVSFFPTPGE